jgi:hypothetical protein
MQFLLLYTSFDRAQLETLINIIHSAKQMFRKYSTGLNELRTLEVKS